MMDSFILYSSVGVLLCLLLVQETRADCNAYNGPSGREECVNLASDYNGSQWATCLTDVYIKQKSKGNHSCIDRTATYCWYQCMIEIHNINPGNYAPVYDDCACVEHAARTTQQPKHRSTLPPLCFSPNGEDCSWYRQCLEAQHPCEGTSAAYAITYAEKFCNLYNDNYHDFSVTGQRWINAVRKCLQTALVKFLRSFVNSSCDNIRQSAFDSHAPCYLSPGPGEPSICDIPGDWWEIFKTIRSAIKSDTGSSLKGMLEVALGCPGIYWDHVWNIGRDIKKIVLNIERGNSPRLKMPTTLEELDELARAVADAIASKLGLSESGIMWYAYSNSSRFTSIVHVDMLITGKLTYDLGSTKVSYFNLTAIIEKVVKAVQDGDLFFTNIGANSESIYVKLMKECIDFGCQRVNQEVTAPPNRYISSAFGLTNSFMRTVFTLFAFLIVITVM